MDNESIPERRIAVAVPCSGPCTFLGGRQAVNCVRKADGSATWSGVPLRTLCMKTNAGMRPAPDGVARGGKSSGEFAPKSASTRETLPRRPSEDNSYG